MIVLLAYYPGIFVSDGVVQWHQIQTGNIDNWHPAYATIFFMILTKIINRPAFLLFVQVLIMSFSIGYFFRNLNKYYNVNRNYLLLAGVILAIIPLNYNLAVTFLKDTLYSTFIILLSAETIKLINETDYFKKHRNCIFLSLVMLLVLLFRHNGIITIILFDILLIIFYFKEKKIYVICKKVAKNMLYLELNKC